VAYRQAGLLDSPLAVIATCRAARGCEAKYGLIVAATGGRFSNSRGKGVNKMLFMPREEGQGLVEYALILVLVAIVVIAILLLLGPAVGNVFSTIVNAI